MKLRKNNRLRRKCAQKVAFNDKKPKVAHRKRVKSPSRRRKSNIVKETAVDNKILRIHLTKVDLNSLKTNFTNPDDIKSKKSDKTLVPENSSNNKVHKKPRFKVKFFPRHRNNNKPKKMVVSNGKVAKTQADVLRRLKSKNSRVFYLKFANYKTASEGKLNYKFHQLVNDVKNMQLPTPAWKIKVIIRHNKIAAIIFTNKSELERSVSFNSDEDKYRIIIDNKPAILLGSPGKVDNCNDIEVLLGILEGIEKDSPMITYK